MYKIVFKLCIHILNVTVLTELRSLWNDSKRGITSGFVVSGFAAGAFILNQAITAILNPNNDSPTLESSSGERYFQQNDILDRVPAIFWMLGSVYAFMQLIGVLLLKRPKLKKKEQIITVSMKVSLAERQQRASSRLEAINAMNKLDDIIERRVSELSVANSDGSYEVLPATTINISKEGTYENVSSSRRNSLDSDDENNYNTVHSTYSTTTIVPYELQPEHDNPSFVPDYEVDDNVADLDGNKRGVGDGNDNSDDDDYNDGGTFGNLRSSPTISRKPKKKKSVSINEASDENNPETTSVTTENINTGNTITTHDTLANNINTNTTETDGDAINMMPMGKKRRFSGVAEKDIETMGSGVAPHKVHFDISADQRRRPSTAERLVLEFRRLSRRLSVPEFVFRNIFGKSNSRRERLMRPLRLFKTKTFYKLWFIFVLNGQGIAFMLTLWKAYGQTFINDDFFLSTVGACSSLFNAFGRITWGIVADKFTFRTVSSAIGAVLTVELKETIGWDGMFFLTGGLSIIVILIAFTFDAETPSGDKI
ncbi:uncharacterized protein LOC106872022 [Octopus bimaculoides]|uniref:uncharacterized protein LOC106872022 n=1 Tax=Octopus bimaculoides TaxID=37653 RepID=UPI0022E855C0|nr:uncharacterized protein LOC106872022 [Octopus bimaculoides]